ncbi:MAG: DUF6146 family protein [Flavobacteriaceae bacterium]|nr:DUF6146 family protein [Flavobacteriaceae bacterium]
MRILLFCILLIGFISSCHTHYPKPKEVQKISFEENEEGDYEIIVFDSQYETFLLTHAMPISYYSENYYKNQNIFLVTEWNARHNQPNRFNRNLYEVYIDYQPHIAYGLAFEYRLYNFFMFMEWKYDIDIDQRINRYR